MKAGATRRFRAALERLEGNLGWTVARVPFDVHEAWPKMVRLRVVVEVNGQTFRTSLFPDQRGGFCVLVNKQMQKAAGVALGGMIDLAVKPDLEEREPEVPTELAAIFKKEKALAKYFAAMSDSMRKELGNLVDKTKSPEARKRKAEHIAEILMSAMEGEKELPPIVEVAFLKSPKARTGWAAMTPGQRRGHLFGVFYYQTPEARQKRVGKLVQECLRVAER